MTPCPEKNWMGDYACSNKEQCWEPCGDLGKSEEDAVESFPDYGLFEADENCTHEIIDARGGGIKCAKCPGWYCF